MSGDESRDPPFDRWFADAEFDATYGYDLAAFRSITAPDEPPDFAEFWTGLYTRAAEISTDPKLRPAGRDGDLEVYDVEFTSAGGVRLGGWVVLPADGDVERAFVIGHGYGGREAPELRLPAPNAAAIFPCSRGLPSRGLIPGIPPVAADHVLHGLEARDTYVHAGCAADVWCAATALTESLPSPPARLDYIGGSFGGGIGALALPWDGRFTAAMLKVPSFGQHDLRLAMRCTGSGESVRRHVAANPEAREVLRYFDSATAARRITIPTLVAAARWDPSVPPPGQFAVHNSLTGPKELFVLSAGHAEYPTLADEQEELFQAMVSFFDSNG